MDNHNLISVEEGRKGLTSSSLSKLSRDYFTIEITSDYGMSSSTKGYISGDELQKLLNKYGYNIIEIKQS